MELTDAQKKAIAAIEAAEAPTQGVPASLGQPLGFADLARGPALSNLEPASATVQAAPPSEPARAKRSLPANDRPAYANYLSEDMAERVHSAFSSDRKPVRDVGLEQEALRLAQTQGIDYQKAVKLAQQLRQMPGMMQAVGADRHEDRGYVDPNIDGYAKKHGLSYGEAEIIARKRGYVPK